MYDNIESGLADGLIIAILAFIILRLFRVKKIEFLLIFAVLLLFSVTALKMLMSDDGDFVKYLYITAYILVLPFTILAVLSWWMRMNLERTRARLEKEGRLYPPGYGRCKRCGTIVLPGEISCRRCGEYIDVPEELRVKKVNYFECSECKREVPEDAGVCPFCGEVFDDDGNKE
jgi:RNA polymerase subunit RPABC4/transcription elongation factor Spt4